MISDRNAESLAIRYALVERTMRKFSNAESTKQRIECIREVLDNINQCYKLYPERIMRKKFPFINSTLREDRGKVTNY